MDLHEILEKYRDKSAKELKGYLYGLIDGIEINRRSSQELYDYLTSEKNINKYYKEERED